MTIIENFCEDISKYYPSINEFQGLYVANCVVNSILAVFTVVGNATVICALMRTASSLSASKILLLGLAISDLGVGLVVQPLYITVMVEMLLEGSVSSGSQCNTKIAFLVVGCFLTGASFFIVSAISFDRFLAISLHLRYKEIVTERKIIATLIVLWGISAVAAIGYLLMGDSTREAVSTMFSAIFFVTTSMTFVRIHLAARRHRLQITAQQRPAEENYKDFALSKGKFKSAINIWYLYLIFTACYLPYVCTKMIIVLTRHGQAVKGLFQLSMTLGFVYSLLNPIIFCWRMREIRFYVLELGAKIFPCIKPERVFRITRNLSTRNISFYKRETSHVSKAIKSSKEQNMTARKNRSPVVSCRAEGILTCPTCV